MFKQGVWVGLLVLAACSRSAHPDPTPNPTPNPQLDPTPTPTPTPNPSPSPNPSPNPDPAPSPGNPSARVLGADAHYVKADERACTTDDDCALGRANCCDCAGGGGGLVGVRRDHADAYAERIAALCAVKDVSCPKAAAPSCAPDAAPACIARVCQAVAP